MSTEWVVNSSTGNDTTGAGTRALPYATFAKAYSLAVGGDTIVLALNGSTAYDLAGAITKNLTIRGSGGIVPITGGSAAVNRVVAAGARVRCIGISPAGGTTAGTSGFRAQEGGELILENCTSSGNDRPWTIADTGRIEATDCVFTGNSSVSVYSATGTGEFTRCTGMPATTVDTRGVRDRSGSQHVHTLLRGSSFYAHPELYAAGNRTVCIDYTNGVDTAEGTAAAPTKSNYASMRLRGARRGYLLQAGGGATVIRESASTPAMLEFLWDYDLIGKQDASFNPIELRFSKAHTDWALSAGTTYKRAYSFQPAQIWRNDQYADTTIDRWDGTSYAASALPPMIRPWVTLPYATALVSGEVTLGTWYYSGGFMYSNLGADPNGLLEVPAEDAVGVNLNCATFRLANLVIRGANQTGLQLVDGAQLTGQNLYLLNNGVNGLDMTHGCKATLRGGRSAGNGWDGLGGHMNSELDVEDWTTDLNGDDGISPHDRSRFRIRRLASSRNADRGLVLINQASVDVEDIFLNDNAKGGSITTPTATGQNLSIEGQAQLAGKNVLFGTIAGGLTSARIIDTAKASGFGFTEKATGAPQAITLVGGSAVKNIDIDDRAHVRRETVNAAG